MKIIRLIVGGLATNCYLLISEEELAVIDPGAEPEKILVEIRKIKAATRYIINTHGHSDHTLADEKISKETGAEILIHKAEKGLIGFKANRFLKDGDEIKIGARILKVIHAPGHTRGSICLAGDNFIFTGDTLFKDGCGRTDLPGGSEKDLKESLEKLSKLLKQEILVYPGHGEIFKSK